MKHSSLSFNSLSFNIWLSLLSVLVLFLATVSIALAQTQTDAQPLLRTTDVVNIRSERTQNAPNLVPTPTSFKDTQDAQDTQKTNVENEDTEGIDATTDKPQSFLERARTVLEERRRGGNSVRDQETRQAERETKLSDQRNERIEKFLSNIKRKMDAAISRLSKLAERIESRIVKFEDRGVDMAEATQLLEVAKGSISGAVESIVAAFERAREALGADISRDAFGSVISELKKAKESLRSAHASLVEVIRIMKANLSENKPDDRKNNETDNTPESETDGSDTETN